MSMNDEEKKAMRKEDSLAPGEVKKNECKSRKRKKTKSGLLWIIATTCL